MNQDLFHKNLVCSNLNNKTEIIFHALFNNLTQLTYNLNL
jgi:hypothetical protein